MTTEGMERPVLGREGSLHLPATKMGAGPADECPPSRTGVGVDGAAALQKKLDSHALSRFALPSFVLSCA